MKKEKQQWMKFEIDFLIKNFDNLSNKELSYKLNRSEKSIIMKSHKLRLKKSKTHISKCISKRNKIVGRDVTIELIYHEAKKYKSKSEFQKKDPSLYSAALKLKIINQVCSHMINQSFSIPQLILNKIITEIISSEILYNSRNIIKPYEIDVYVEKYKLAFEYNGKYWHNNNHNDNIKKILCNDKNITLITIIENNRNYEQDIKLQIIKHLPIINNITKLFISEEKVFNTDISSIFENIFDLNEIRNICQKYQSFKEFFKNERKTYRKILRIGKIDEFTLHMKDRRKKRNENEIKEKISNYTNLLDLIKEDNGTYQFIKKNKLEHLLSSLKRK